VSPLLAVLGILAQADPSAPIDTIPVDPTAPLDPAAVDSGVQAATDTLAKIQMPKVDWWAVAPPAILTAGAFFILVLASLLRTKRGVNKSVTWLAIGTTITAAASTWMPSFVPGNVSWINPQWSTIRERGAFSAIADSVRIDGFSVFLTIAICGALAISLLVVRSFAQRELLDGPEVPVLMMLSAAGGLIMVSANDLIVLFLGLEVLSIALYVLAGSNQRRVESQESALKYFVLGAFSSALLLYGIALLYGALGSTNFTVMANVIDTTTFFGNRLLAAGVVLMLVGLGFKVAAVPFHMWTPDVYQGAPSPITGFMAATAKIAGFAAMLRVFVSALNGRSVEWRPAVWLLALITIVVGSILAVMQTDVKRMMAYSSISHAGFIMLGLEAAGHRGDVDGIPGSLFYLFAYAFIVVGSFTVITVVGGRGDSRHAIDDYRGLGKRNPLLALCFTVFLLAQAGVPFTSGFVAKFGVIAAAVSAKSYAIAIVAMLSAVVAAFFYLRVIVRMFMDDPIDGEVVDRAGVDGDRSAAIAIPAPLVVALVITVAFTLILGVLPQGILDFARQATLR
jgi:NADH-quinone oxidoreductase subunit N